MLQIEDMTFIRALNQFMHSLKRRVENLMAGFGVVYPTLRKRLLQLLKGKKT